MILMHDLLQEMGKEIVREKSDNELGRQSRIWDEDDLYHILENREEKNKVEAIVTHLVRGKKYRFEDLSFMKELRLLHLNGPDDSDCDGPKFPYNLKYLEWKGFPFTKLTSISNFRKLVQLKLSGSKLRQLCWKGIEPLCNLKVIEISYSWQFTKFEDFTVVPNLKKLILDSCSKLSEIHPSIKHLKRLIMLYLTNCISLEKLPEEINGLTSLQTLDLEGCTSLKKLTKKINDLASLQTLILRGCTSLEKLAEEINGLASLQTLDLKGCTTLKKLADEINSLASLQTLDLVGCTSLEKLAEEINSLASLQTLDLSGCISLEKLAEEINGLASLWNLYLIGCTSLEKLAEKINDLASLQILYLGDCTSLEKLAEEINGLASLETLYLWGCTSLKKLAEEINGLASLQDLHLGGCTSLEKLIEEINGLASLQTLDLKGCTSLEKLSEEINGLASLQTLDLGGCTSLEKLTEKINGLTSLQTFDLGGCTSLEKLPEEINGLASLQTLNLVGCTSLEKLAEEINGLISLQTLDLRGCTSLKILADEINGPASLQTLNLGGCTSLEKLAEKINGLASLQTLNLRGCTSLKTLAEEINGMASLQTLNIEGCSKLEKLPDNLEQLKSLRKLAMRFCIGIKRLPPSIFLLENIESVSCDEELIGLSIRENIISNRTIGKCFLPGSFGTRLTRMDLSDCNLSGPEAFPEHFGKLVGLEYLDLSKNPFPVLPPGIKGCTNLQTLRLEHCKSLRCLEAELLPSSLQVVEVNYCTSLVSFLDPLKPSHLRCSEVICLECTELVKRQAGKMTALASLTRFLDQDTIERRYREFKFVIPQSDNELPSWFINQSSTPSITIKLDPNWHNRELLGFAMVFCFRANSCMEDYFYCRASLPSRKTWATTVEVGAVGSRMSDHLVLLYIHRVNANKPIKQLQPPSWETLEFSFFSKYGSSCGPCGVRLVYEEDIQELMQITSNYINDQKDVQSSHSQSWREPENRPPDLEDNLVLAKRQSR